MHSKLLCDSKADVAADRIEWRIRGMSDIPIHCQPKVHARTHAHKGRDSCQQYVASAPALSDLRDAVILRM